MGIHLNPLACRMEWRLNLEMEQGDHLLWWECINCHCILNLQEKGGCESEVIWFWFEAPLPKKARESAKGIKGKGSKHVLHILLPIKPHAVKGSPVLTGTVCRPFQWLHFFSCLPFEHTCQKGDRKYAFVSKGLNPAGCVIKLQHISYVIILDLFWDYLSAGYCANNYH